VAGMFRWPPTPI